MLMMMIIIRIIIIKKYHIHAENNLRELLT